MIFEDYAEYYDLLYRDKDYRGEVDFILDRLGRNGIRPGNAILDFGCGTARHASLMTEAGYVMHGVDGSERMITIAERRRAAAPAGAASLTLSVGDMRTARLGREFDAVQALFHVMSYQTTDDDLDNALLTMSLHARPDGFVLFDFWNGDAVLKDKPAERTKRIETEQVIIDRKTRPQWYPEKNLVVVNFTMDVTLKASGKTGRIEEAHPMRYLFVDEMMERLHRQGLVHVETGTWLTGKTPTADDWSVYMIARRPAAHSLSS